MLAVEEGDRTFEHLDGAPLKPGKELPTPTGVFPRIADVEAAAS